MRKGSLVGVAIIFILCGLVILLGGCKDKRREKKSAKPAETTKDKSQEKATSEQKVIMMGRSVMDGWFEHWGYDWEKPVKREGYTLYYKELEIPPDIVDSAQTYVEENSDENAIVFFKLCFDDFVSGSKSDVNQNLRENKKYTRGVCDLVVKEHGLKLILGNALPHVENYTDSSLVRNNISYNEYLEELADEYGDNVVVFDQYSILTDDEGNLKSEYAVDEEDSHLNEKAYDALDDSFFKLLEENF